jgi:glycosyltransferase involved in cell wall biosynthesis
MKLIRREKPDLIHAHLFKSMIFAALAAKLAGIPCVLHDHSGLDQDSLRFYFPNSVDRWLYALAFQQAIRFSVRLLGLTPEICSAYVKHFKIPPTKVEVIPNAVNLDRFQPADPAVGIPLRVELGLADLCRIIVMVGRLAPEKDWQTFLQVARRCPDPGLYAFVVVGAGKQGRQLHNMASKLGLTNVYFLGDRQDVPSILAEADLFLLTSRREAFGIVLLEAMAAGCPVIATRTAGPASIIQPESNGLLVDIGDVDGFVICIERVLSDSRLADRLVGNARLSLKQFDLPVVSRRLADIYDQVLHECGTKLP